MRIARQTGNVQDITAAAARSSPQLLMPRMDGWLALRLLTLQRQRQGAALSAVARNFEMRPTDLKGFTHTVGNRMIRICNLVELARDYTGPAILMLGYEPARVALRVYLRKLHIAASLSQPFLHGLLFTELTFLGVPPY
jgi:hypothetical protein